MKDEPDLVGDGASTGGPVGGEMGLARLDQILGLAAGAVEGLIDDARADGSEVGDDEADVETESVASMRATARRSRDQPLAL